MTSVYLISNSISNSNKRAIIAHKLIPVLGHIAVWLCRLWQNFSYNFKSIHCDSDADFQFSLPALIIISFDCFSFNYYRFLDPEL